MQANASTITVLIMAGGTGGHVFPALAVAKALEARGVNVEWLGTERGIESRVVPANGIKLHYLDVQGIRGKNILSRVKAVLHAIKSVFSAISLIRQLQPICVVGLGGYAAGPGGIAAWLNRTPLLIHEQNAVAGTTNRILARFAGRVMTGYPIALGGAKNSYIGNPVRAEISRLPSPEIRWSERNGPLRLLVLGGSQGALAINTVVVETLSRFDAGADLQVRHQAGAAHIESIKGQYESVSVDVKAEAFVEDMAEAYAWADIVLCRAGALTVAELTAAGVGAWLVPLPNAIDDHQRANARWLEENGAGEILEQAELDVELLSSKLRDAIGNRDRLLELAKSARKLAMPDAAEVAADYCMEYANG